MIRIAPTPLNPLRAIPVMVGGTLLLILIAWALIGYPLRRAAHETDQRLREVESILATYESVDGHTVDTLLQQEQWIHERLITGWENKRQRAQTTKVGSALTDILTYSVEGRIDFKVALFEARQRLGRKALEQQVLLPPDLGIPDTIGADEDAEIRLGQLAATVRLLEQCITHEIPLVEQVQVLPPSIVPLQNDAYQNITFYPVKIQLMAPYERLAELLSSMMEEGSFFALRRLRLESGAPHDPEQVSVMAVWSAIVYSSAGPSRQRPTSEQDDESWMVY